MKIRREFDRVRREDRILYMNLIKNHDLFIHTEYLEDDKVTDESTVSQTTLSGAIKWFNSIDDAAGVYIED